MTAKSKLLREILSTMKRYSEESDVTIMETIEAAQEAVRIVVAAALNAKGEEKE